MYNFIFRNCAVPDAPFYIHTAGFSKRKGQRDSEKERHKRQRAQLPSSSLLSLQSATPTLPPADTSCHLIVTNSHPNVTNSHLDIKSCGRRALLLLLLSCFYCCHELFAFTVVTNSCKSKREYKWISHCKSKMCLY